MKTAYHTVLEKKSEAQLHEVITGFYAVLGEANDQQLAAAVAACDILEYKYYKDMEYERNEIKEVFEEYKELKEAGVL